MNQNDKKLERQSIKEKKAKAQNEILSGIIDNESKTYTFEATVSMAGEKKTGTFTAKYLGVAARLRIGTIRAKLLDGAPASSVDTLTDDIAYIMAYLTVAFTKTPSWWNYDDIDEFEDLKNIYLEVYKFIQSFRAKNVEDTNAGYSTNSTGQEDVEN